MPIFTGGGWVFFAKSKTYFLIFWTSFDKKGQILGGWGVFWAQIQNFLALKIRKFSTKKEFFNKIEFFCICRCALKIFARRPSPKNFPSCARSEFFGERS